MSQHVTNDFYTQCKPFYAEQQLKFNRTQIKQKSIINQVLQVKGHYKLLPVSKNTSILKIFPFWGNQHRYYHGVAMVILKKKVWYLKINDGWKRNLAKDLPAGSQEKAFFGHRWVSCLKMGMSKIPNIIYSDPRTIVLKFQKYRSNRTCVIAKKLCVYRQKTTYPYHHTKVKNLQLYKNCLFGVTQRSLKHCDMFTVKQPTFYIYMYVNKLYS